MDVGNLAKKIFEQARDLADVGERSPNMDVFKGLVGGQYIEVRYFPNGENSYLRIVSRKDGTIKLESVNGAGELVHIISGKNEIIIRHYFKQGRYEIEYPKPPEGDCENPPDLIGLSDLIESHFSTKN